MKSESLESPHLGYMPQRNSNQQQHQELRPMFNSHDSSSSYHSQSEYHHPQALMPQQQQQPSRVIMSSSQPTTPKPTSSEVATIATDASPLESKYNPITSASMRDHKDSLHETCPSFGLTQYNHNVFSMDRHTIIDVRLHTKVDRGFFLADNDWTCYRRNYFQVSGSFSLEGVGALYDGQDFPCLVKDDRTNQFEEIHCFMLGVTAQLSDCEKQIQLIQHTPKRDKGPQVTPAPRSIRPGGNIGFSAVGSSQSIVTFERLQFKTATANNGKRRAAQQYYVIIVELLAKLRNGQVVPVATTKSSCLVVRGRSPGHYAETDSGIARQPHHRSSNASNSGGPLTPTSVMSPYSNNRHQPYNRPATYATKYMPYEYNGHGNYQQSPTSNTVTPTTSYPGTPPLPILNQQQHNTYGIYDRSHPAAAPSDNAYPNSSHASNNGGNQYEYHGGEPQDHKAANNNPPYYLQRNTPQHGEQEHWQRMRMASNNSEGSHAESPYGPPQQQQQHSNGGYYTPQPYPAAPNNTAYSAAPTPQQQHELPHPSQHFQNNHHDHYYQPQQQQQYDWPPRPKMPHQIYSYESENERRQRDYEQHHNSTPPPPSLNGNNNQGTASPINREATVVK